jgi:hypothetical protein
VTDIPGKNEGEWGKRQYQIQLLTPNLHRPGQRWRNFGTPFDELAKAEYAIDDIVRSMASEVGATAAYDWRKNRVRVMELLTECKYGREIALPGS